MSEFNHKWSGIIWGFGMIRKATGAIVASGPFCYLADGQRWECGRDQITNDYYGCYCRLANGGAQ